MDVSYGCLPIQYVAGVDKKQPLGFIGCVRHLHRYSTQVVSTAVANGVEGMVLVTEKTQN